MADIFETTDAAGTSTIYTLEIGDRFFGRVEGDFLEDGDTSDYVRFSVLAGDTISFAAEYTTNVDAGFDIQLSIRDSQGDFVRDSNFDPLSNGATHTFLAAGTYFANISIGDIFDSGDYQFELSYAETPDDVDFITPLETYFGEISISGEIDRLKVNVEEGVSYRIVLNSVEGPGEEPDTFEQGLIWGQFVLTAEDDELVGEAFYEDGRLTPVLIFSASDTETLNLDISSNYPGEFDFDTGAYSVQLDRIDVINGTDLADTLDGTDGADAMNGFAGNDTIYGERGDDLIYGQTGKDRIWDGKGADTVDLGDGNDYVRVGGGEDSFFGGEGKDYISYYDSRNGVTIDLGNDEVSGSWAVNDTIDGFESASGSKTGNDLIMGSEESNTIRTYGGRDKVYAGKGEDRVYLGDGNDYVRVGGGEESFFGGAGDDYLSYYDSNNGVTVDLAANEVSGSWAVNDTIDGFENASGSKTGTDTLLGTDGDNRMRGYGGSDTLDGRGGDDALYGGADADVFIIRPGDGADEILDFEGGIDTIQLIGFDLTAFDLSEMGETIDGRSFINFSATDSISIYTGTFAELLDSIELL